MPNERWRMSTLTQAFAREAAMRHYRITLDALRECEANLLLSWGWRRRAAPDVWEHDGVDGGRTQAGAMTLLLEELDG